MSKQSIALAAEMRFDRFLNLAYNLCSRKNGAAIMYAKFSVGREAVDDFIRLFVNRRAYGMQAQHPLPNGKVPYFLAKDWATKQPKPLDPSVVRMHLNGDITINLYAINPETQRCKWVAIDGDFDGAVDALFRLQWELSRDGVEAAIEQSRRGGHLWIFAETPLLAKECRIYIYNLALRLGVPIVGAGLKQGIEIFPKQDQIEADEFGNAIRAPLGVHRKTNRRYWFYDAQVTPEMQLDRLKQLKKLTENELRIFIKGMTLPESYKPAIRIPRRDSAFSSGQEFRILDHVQPHTKDRRNWWAPCPSCRRAGRDKSGDNLSIQITDPRYYKCWAGCTADDIRASLGQPTRKKLTT